MHIGILTLRLRIEGAESLKDKRQAIKSLVHRIRHRFNVSAAETGDLELWQRSTVGVAVVSNDSRIANKVLSHVVNHVENDFRVILDDYTVEMVMDGDGEAVADPEEDEADVFEKWFEK